MNLFIISLATIIGLYPKMSNLFQTESIILNEGDMAIVQQRIAENRPALSSALDEEKQWKSFDQWGCFDPKNLKIECSEYENGKFYVPSISTNIEGRNIVWDLSAENRYNCPSILEHWKLIMSEEDEICILSAYLQELKFTQAEEKPSELWILSALKTKDEFWIAYDAKLIDY